MSRPAIIRNSKSIAGFAMVVLGTFILHANLAAALACMHHMLAAARTAHVVPAVMLTALQTAQAGGANQHLVRVLLQHTLLMFWPLVLVVAGSFLSRPAITGHFNFFKKDF